MFTVKCVCVFMSVLLFSVNSTHSYCPVLVPQGRCTFLTQAAQRSVYTLVFPEISKHKCIRMQMNKAALFVIAYLQMRVSFSCAMKDSVLLLNWAVWIHFHAWLRGYQCKIEQHETSIFIKGGRSWRCLLISSSPLTAMCLPSPTAMPHNDTRLSLL